MIIVFSIHYCVCCFFEKNRFKGTIKAVLAILICIWIFHEASYEKLKNGGIYFITEKETDAIVKESKIENIFDPSKRLHGFKSSYGADIQMDGDLLFIESVDGFNIGDRVMVKYLPKSTCVLEIKKIENIL